MFEQQDESLDVNADREAFLASVENPKIRKLIGSLGPFPYRFETLFPKTTGMGAVGDVKRRVRLLEAVQPRLDLLLYPDERIEFVTYGQLNNWFEQYLLGWAAYLMNYRVFLFTNYRVILLDARSKRQLRKMQWQIPYDEITKFSPGGCMSLSANMTFRLTNGKSYSFAHVPSRDRQQLRDFVNQQIKRVGRDSFQFPHHQPFDSLCPACCTPLPKSALMCETCDEPLINPSTPAMMSAAFPCLGDFYLGHRLLGTLELLGYVSVILIIAALYSEFGQAAIPWLLLLLALQHGIDALFTLHMAKKGALLKRDAWKAH